LPMRNINHLHGSSKIHMLKLNNSMTMEPKSTLDATRQTQNLDTNHVKQISSQLSRTIASI
jgi:copper homeostasis protein CutC